MISLPSSLINGKELSHLFWHRGLFFWLDNMTSKYRVYESSPNIKIQGNWAPAEVNTFVEVAGANVWSYRYVV